MALAVAIAHTGVSVAAVQADDAAANFELEPGATCLTEPRLAERIESWLGRPLPPAGAAASLRVEGSPHDPRSAQVAVALEGEVQATRDFAPGPPRCDDLVDAVAIAATMMLQALPPEAWLAAEAVAPPPPAPPPVPPPVPAAPPPPAPTEPPAPPAAPTEQASPLPLRLWLLAAGVFQPAAGGSGGGGRAGLGLDLGSHVDLQTTALVVASPSRRLSDGQGRYQSLWYQATLGVCAGQHAAARLGVRACAELLGGKLRVRGAQTSSEPTVGFSLGLQAQARLSDRWQATLAVRLVHRSPPVTVEGEDALGQPVGTTRVPPAGALLELGLRRVVFTKPDAPWGMKGE